MRYYIIAGEASGDLHGANLMKGIYEKEPDASIRFWGGDLMNEVCMRSGRHGIDGSGLVHHYKEGAVMGFVEVLTKGFKLLANLKSCKKDILQWNPDVVIFIDYPGFNFKIAAFAHKHGFKTFYYIAPKVWASREGRIRRLKRDIDKLFIVFPFEIPYFTSKGVDFVYKGNPLVDAVDGSAAMKENASEFFERNSLTETPFIAMLAGSRSGEIKTMMPVLTAFARKMHGIEKYRNWQFIVAGAPSRCMEDYTRYLSPEEDYIKIVFGQTQSVIRHAQVAVVNSGTASLETVLFGTPQIVGYIVPSRLTYWIARKIVKVKYISLGNLIVDKEVFPEFIQDDCNPDKILSKVCSLIEDDAVRSEMLQGYEEIRTLLGGSGASRSVASAMIEELRKH